MKLSGHLKATASLTLIVANLLVWSLPLVLLLFTRTLVPASRGLMSRLGIAVYRHAVAFDDWVLNRVSGAHWHDPYLELHRDEVIVVVANHRSWTDVFLLQSIISKRGPIVKFLCKRELTYIPILGLICLAFEFPVLRRRARGAQSEHDRRDDDRRRVRDACEVLYKAPAAMLIFAEGTRFTELRRNRSRSPYLHLLAPRLGGFSAMLDVLESLDPKLIDVTIAYTNQSNFWQFLGGSVGKIKIEATQFSMRSVVDCGIGRWLEERWTCKDALLDDIARGRSLAN